MKRTLHIVSLVAGAFIGGTTAILFAAGHSGTYLASGAAVSAALFLIAAVTR